MIDKTPSNQKRYQSDDDQSIQIEFQLLSFYLRQFQMGEQMLKLFYIILKRFFPHLFDITAYFYMSQIAQNSKDQYLTNSRKSGKLSTSTQQIPASNKTTYQPIIYCHERKKKCGEIASKYLFSLPQVILLSLLGYFQTIPNMCLTQNGQQYYGTYQTNQTSKLGQLIKSGHFKVEQLSQFEKRHKDRKLIPRGTTFRDLLWLDSNDEDSKLIMDHLMGYQMNFFRLQSNILVQNSLQHAQQFSVLIENLRKGKYLKRIEGKAKNNHQSKCKYISHYLLIQLKQNQMSLLNKFCTIERQTKYKKLYKYNSNNMTFQIILEFCDVFEMIIARNHLMSKQICIRFISQSFFQQSIYKFKLVTQDNFSPKFDIQKLVCQLHDSDILSCQRHMNTTQNDFFHNIRFMLENEQAFFPHYQKKLELLIRILKSYSSQTVSPQSDKGELYSFQKFDKKYTAALLHAKLLLPKLQKIVQQTEDSKKLTRQISKRNNNNLLGSFVENLKSMADNKQMRIIEGGKQISVPQKIATYYEYQGWSTRVARWDKLYQTIAMHHSHSQTLFKSTIESLEQKEEEEGKEEGNKEGRQQKRNASLSKKDFKKRKIQQLQSRKQFMENVQQQQFPNLSCLGCTTFFYYNMNIRNIDICSTPYHLAGLSSQIQLNKGEISQAMLDLMNCLGGVILFDCVAEGRQVLPRGCEHTEERQEQLKNELQNIYQQIQYDSSEIKTEMQITFVPIFKNPYKHNPYKSGKRKKKWNFFVTRIKINRMINKQNQKEIKYESAEEERQIAFFRQKITCFHEGHCEVLLSYPPRQKIYKEKKQKKPEKIEQLPLQKKFKFVSLINTQRDIEYLQSELNNNDLQCKISTKYRNYGLQKAKKFAILFHNSSLQKIKQYCKNNKNNVIITEIKPFLYFSRRKDGNPINKKDFNDILGYTLSCAKQFQNELVILWKYQATSNPNGKGTELYFQMQSKEKAALMYLIFFECSQKVYFKYPNERKKDGEYKFEQFKQKDLQKCQLLFKSQEDQEKSFNQIEEQLKDQLYNFFQEVAKSRSTK